MVSMIIFSSGSILNSASKPEIGESIRLFINLIIEYKNIVVDN